MSLVVIESAAGHHFMSTESDDMDSCLTCGAMYVLQDRGDGVGQYVTACGDTLSECTRNTDMDHGYEFASKCTCILCQ